MKHHDAVNLQIRPILPRFGAEVAGLDLTQPLSAEARKAVLEVQSEWGVTVWRNTGLTDETHIAFSRTFGQLELAPAPNGRPFRHKHRELFDASNLDPSGNINQDELVRLHSRGNQIWHTDASYMKIRTALSMLLCHEAPPVDGQTLFADLRTAYEDLPQSMKDRIETLHARHSLWWSRKLGGYPLTDEDVDARGYVSHPLVHVHKGSGRKALYLAAHARDIDGLPREEGVALLRELTEFATQPKYVFAISYHPGDLVIWDNLCTMHRGGKFDEVNHRRDMRRTSVREGDAPAGFEDQFTDLYKTAGITPFTKSNATR
jgi:alpha-ketoglutarate-dependent 2,4-dichlorophenoxyacetate dioxygenase